MASKLRSRTAAQTENNDGGVAVAEPPPVRTLTGRRIDPALLREAINASKAASDGARTPFLKLTGGQNQIRILGPKNPDVDLLPYFRFRVHKWEAGKKEAVDLDFLFGFPELTQRAIAAGKITQDDFSKWQRFGNDPWNIVGERAKAAGFAGGKGSTLPYFFSTAAYAFNVLNRADGSIGLWTVGKERFEALEALAATVGIYDEGPEGNDVYLIGNGKDGKMRRYVSLYPVPKPSPAAPEGEIDAARLVDLTEFAIRRVVGWDRKVIALFSTYGQWIEENLGLTPRTFGVEANVSSAAVNSGADGDSE